MRPATEEEDVARVGEGPGELLDPGLEGEGLPERDAIARANLYAALSTMSIGTQKSFVTRERFDEEWKSRA